MKGVCGPSDFSYYYHASWSHKLVIKCFCAKAGGRKPREIVFLFPPVEKVRKIHSLLPSLTNSVTTRPPPLRGSHFLTEITHVQAAAAPNYTHAVWLKVLHTWQKVGPFLKIPTVNNRPGAAPRVLAQMHLTTGSKQTGTANFMGQLWREANKYVERSTKKIRLASSHGAVMFHEIHILC